MRIKTIEEVARKGGLATARKHKGKHAIWGRKGAKKRWAEYYKNKKITISVRSHKGRQ